MLEMPDDFAARNPFDAASHVREVFHDAPQCDICFTPGTASATASIASPRRSSSSASGVSSQSSLRST